MGRVSRRGATLQLGDDTDHVGRYHVTTEIGILAVKILRLDPEPRLGAPSQPRRCAYPPDGFLWDTRRVHPRR